MRDDPLKMIRQLGRRAVQALPAVPVTALAGTPLGIGAAAVDARQAPDTMYARIRVRRQRSSPGRPEAFGVEAWCRGVPRLPYTSGDGQRRPAAISLANARPGGAPPSELLRSIHRWSLNQGVLTRWINRCRQTHGDALQIVILDQTGFDLPWEALTLPPVPEAALRGGMLGALVDMARWFDAVRGSDDFPTDVAAPAGAVLGYFHPDMRSDREVFHAYEHRPHSGIVSFLKSLDEHDADRTGLVYMGCHGTFDQELSNLTLADVTWAEYHDHGMRLLGRDGSLVCLNACHSGRFLDHDGDGRQYLRGFTEVFLGNGAGGCIVTAGKVGDAEARELIRGLVDAVTADPDRPVAQALRAFRAAAHDSFVAEGGVPLMVGDDGALDRQGQRNVLRLLYSLMFQYYGHPLSTLHLTSRYPDSSRAREGGRA